MIVAIHQPNFIPWIGYFYKIARSDVFVILDNVQFTKNGFTNRNRIKTPNGETWLTLPIMQSGASKQLITDCIISKQEHFANKIVKTLKMNYAKAPFKDWVFDWLEPVLMTKEENLAEYNTSVLSAVVKMLEIPTDIRIASLQEGISGESTNRLVSICQNLNATTYLAGFGAKKYQDSELFEKVGIKATTSEFQHPEYQQLWGEFTPNLSIIDFLMNVGPDARKYFH